MSDDNSEERNATDATAARVGTGRAPGPFAAYLDLMLRVDALISQSLDESPAGTALRDQMDQPWYAMTEDERDQIRAIGAALNAARDAARESVQREIASLDRRVAALESKVEYL